jgi:hypothetical protein
MSISKIKIVAVAIVAMTVVGLCAAMVTGAAGFPQPGTTQQDDVEDCDAEDWANREDDFHNAGTSAKPLRACWACLRENEAAREYVRSNRVELLADLARARMFA